MSLVVMRKGSLCIVTKFSCNNDEVQEQAVIYPNEKQVGSMV